MTLPSPTRSTENLTIAVTGTTGALGSYLLNFLITDPKIKRIFAINRTADAVHRQEERNHSQGLSTDWTKVSFLVADLSKAQLGLDTTTYAELQNETDRFIHNAWPVNFNLTLTSFEPYIRGVRHLIDFSAKSVKRPNIVFISSIGAVQAWDAPEPVPEKPLTDLKLASPGYGQSKLVSSLILDAAREVGIPSTIIRLGQVAGPTTSKGVWNRHEWFPTIVNSSLYLGVLPSNLGAFDKAIDWCPVDPLAKFVLELGDSQGYFHAVCPRATTWANLRPALRDFYADRIKREVGFKEWTNLLKKSALDADAKKVAENPGIKLMDTFQAFADGEGREPIRYETERACGASATLNNLDAVSSELMKSWAEQWAF
jgi:thioester reductase-like protein